MTQDYFELGLQGSPLSKVLFKVKSEWQEGSAHVKIRKATKYTW